jgi:serine/threonine protein kinase/tetratricopeptide (TPR) repeat protein
MPERSVLHYRILDEVGRGGMGIVYKAEDTRLRRTVALKFPPPGFSTQTSARERYLREARALATVNHPNVAHVYEVNEFEGEPFIAMEFIEGITLSRMIEDREPDPLPLPDVVRYSLQIAEGLQAAHQKGIVHRDIKSSNVLIGANNRIKITDFGLASIQGHTRITQEGVALGTVAYMSPEQARGNVVDQRTDLWSLGVIMYELLTGRLPFASTYDQATIYSILNEAPTPLRSIRPDIPEELARIVATALAKAPDERYPDAAALMKDLRSIESPGSASTPSVNPASTQVSRRALMFVPLLLGVLGGAALLWFSLNRSTTAREKPSIAVLPFENLGDSSNAYIAVGLVEAITNEIGKIPDLTVIARNSTIRYAGGRPDLQQVARDLGVRFVLEGTVQRSATKLRIFASLTDASTARQLWGEKFEGSADDLMRLQDDIAQKMLTALTPTLSPGQRSVLHLQPTASKEAYDEYLSGRFFLDKSYQQETDTAIARFQKAIDLDPHFALAYASLARAYATKIFASDSNAYLQEKATVAIDKALTYDPDLAEAYVARTALLWTRTNGFPHERAAREAFKALAINPNLVEAHEWAGSILFHVGVLDRAMDHFRAASLLDPTSKISPPRIGRLLWYQQKFGEALDRFQEIPDSKWRDEKARVLHYLGRDKEAFALLLDSTWEAQNTAPSTGLISRIAPTDITAMLAFLYAASGDTANALRNIAISEETGASSSHFHHAEFSIASAYALMKRNKNAVEWLRKAANDGFPCYPLFLNDPAMQPLKNDPEYVALMDGMKKQWEYYSDSLK